MKNEVINELLNYSRNELETALRKHQETAITGIISFIRDTGDVELTTIEGKKGFHLLSDVEVISGGANEEKHIWTITGVIMPQSGVMPCFLAENDNGDRFIVGASDITFGLSEIIEAMVNVLNKH